MQLKFVHLRGRFPSGTYAENYMSMALQSFCWTLAAFSVSQAYTQSVRLLDGGTAGRKAAIYTHNNTNI
jgi:hypothetical protein